MARIDEILPKQPNEGILGYSKDAQDIYNSQQRIEREKELLKLLKDEAERRHELEIKNQLQREIDRKSDRRFLWVVSLVCAVIGAVVASVVALIFK